MVQQSAVVDLEDAGGDPVDEVPVVGDQQKRPGVVIERIAQRLDGAHVEVVGGLVQEQEVGVSDEQREQAQAAAFAAREHLDPLLDLVRAELEAAQQAACRLLVVADERQAPSAARCRVAQFAALLRVVGEAHVVAQVGDAAGRLRRPTMVSTSVVLPEPLAPRRATFSPRSRTRSTSRTRV